MILDNDVTNPPSKLDSLMKLSNKSERKCMDKHLFLKNYIDIEFNSLLHSVKLYVWRSKLAYGEHATVLAMDILNEVVVDALRNYASYDENRQPRPWLMGMVIIAIKRRIASQAKLRQREPLIRDIYDDTALSDDELFDIVTEVVDNSPAQGLTSEEAVQTLLAPVSNDDKKILRLAIIDELDSASLSQEYGISANAVRVRLHRALHRLRQAHGRVKDMNDEY